MTSYFDKIKTSYFEKYSGSNRPIIYYHYQVNQGKCFGLLEILIKMNSQNFHYFFSVFPIFKGIDVLNSVTGKSNWKRVG